MIQNVMTHLVGHHFANLGQCTSLEQIVIERNAGGTEKASNVRADPPGLSRSIDHEDFVDRNFVGTRHRQNRLANFRIVEGLVSVKKWFDKDRRDKSSKD